MAGIYVWQWAMTYRKYRDKQVIVLVFRNIGEATKISALIVFPAGCLEQRMEHKLVVMCVVIPSVSIEPNDICTNLKSFKEKETFEMDFDGSEFLGQGKEVS